MDGAESGQPKIRILVVEDSVTQREILCRIVRENGDLIVVGEARDGAEAVDKVRELSPDVVLMDIHMDNMNGIDATRLIMRDNPVPVVIMSSTLQPRDIDLAVEAMRIGAVTAIEKPKGAALLHLAKIAPKLYKVLRDAAATTVRRTQSQGIPSSPVRRVDYQPPAEKVKVIGVCSSAGGPSVLVEIFAALPADFPIPILLVQHISPGFEDGFASWLSKQTAQNARIARETQKLAPGIWLGSTDQHLVMTSPRQFGLQARGPHDIHCPGGNYLFESIARHQGKSSVGVVLTGMGDDGANGLSLIKQAGGQAIIQDEATAMVWGMPRAAKKANAVDYELNPREIAIALCRLVKG